MIETIEMTDRSPIPIKTKLNPLWWLVGPDGWAVPDVNNGEPYLPEVTNIWLRRFYWFGCRNPLMNFIGFVIGVEDNNYRVTGTAPVLATTFRDTVPPRHGWKWSVIFPRFSIGALITAAIFAALAFALHWSFWVLAVFALLKIAGPLPFVSYYDGTIEFYHGWRPASGGFGTKFIVHGK